MEIKDGKAVFTADEQPLIDGMLQTERETAVTKFKTESEETRRKAIPEKYEFKFKDGSPLDSKSDAEKIAAFAKAQGLTAEQAQTYLAHQEEIAGGIVQRQKQFLTDESAKWKTEVETDKDLGGANIEATRGNIKRAMDHFAPETSPEGQKLRALLNDTGYGNHPLWVRFVNQIGKAMAEDNGGGGFGSGGKAKKKEDHEIVYPTK